MQNTEPLCPCGSGSSFDDCHAANPLPYSRGHLYSEGSYFTRPIRAITTSSDEPLPFAELHQYAGALLWSTFDFLQLFPPEMTFDSSALAKLDPDDQLRDLVILMVTLSCWKWEELARGVERAWTESQPPTIDAITAAVLARSALEEAAHLYSLADKLTSGEPKLLETMKHVVLNNGELSNWSKKKGIGVAVANLLQEGGFLPRFTPDDAGYRLYESLSALAHPEGPSRAAFRDSAFSRGETTREWFMASRSIGGLAEQHAVAIAGLVASSALLLGASKRMLDFAAGVLVAAPDENCERTSIWVPPSDWWTLAAGQRKVTAVQRVGLWCLWTG